MDATARVSRAASPSPHFEIVAQAEPSEVARTAEGRAVDLARSLATQPHLTADRRFVDLAARRIAPAPSLLVTDIEEPLKRETVHRLRSLHRRTLVRAGDGDLIASLGLPEPAWRAYCSGILALGHPQWLTASAPRPESAVATRCWIDRRTRHDLVRALREGRLVYLHPHEAGYAAWQLARLLRAKSGRPIEVVGPPPGLSRVVNDKIWFTQLIQSLFGETTLPRSLVAGNFATLAQVVRRLAEGSRAIVIKLPEASGGAGNLVLDASEIRQRPLGEVRAFLRSQLLPLAWHGETQVLASAWEQEVLQSPSSQLWIPPLGEGEPVVEGLFEQILGGRRGEFRGARPASLPRHLLQTMTDWSWLLARVFQELGYVGRCSFDLLVLGPSLERGRLELIECNGRWGGTSLPMTLAHRLRGDHVRHPFTARQITIPGLQRFAAQAILDHLEPLLLRAHAGGEDDARRLVVYNLVRHRRRRELALMAFGADADERERFLASVEEDLVRLAADG